MIRKTHPIVAACALGLAALACNLPVGGIGAGGGNAVPLVKIDSPATGDQFNIGDEIAIISTAIDPNGIVRIDLQVNGQIVRSDSPPNGDGGQVTVTQTFTASEPGTLSVAVVAVNSQDNAATGGPISIEVVAESESSVAATETPQSAIESEEPTPTATETAANATATATPTATPTATATATATATRVLVRATDTPVAPLVADRAVFVRAERDPADTSYGLVTLSVEFSGGQGPYTIYDQGQPLTTSDPHGTFERNGRTMFWIHYGPIRWRCGTTLVGDGVIESKDGQQSGFNFYVDNVQC
ncbi:MAG: Ig-like domain-containing protein [Anaerolineales bacterium]